MLSLFKYQRFPTKIHCKKSEYIQIFAKHPTIGNINIQDAEIACNICKSIPEIYRDECYVIFGIDRRRTEKYLKIVQNLEKSYWINHHQYVIKSKIIWLIETIKHWYILFVTLIHIMFR